MEEDEEIVQPEGDESETKKEVMVEKAMPENSSMSIPLPKGFQPPEGTKDGATFEVIAKAKIQDGRLMFESLDGQTTETEPESMDESDAAAEEALRDAMKSEGLRG